MPNEPYEVAIIGGGVVGCSIAWELLRRGSHVTLLDSNAELFQGSSIAGFGSLTPYSDPFFVGEAREFASYSVDLYRNVWIPELSKEIGSDIPVGNDGLIELCDSDQCLSDAEGLCADLNSTRSGRARMLTHDDVKKMEPNLTGKYSGAVWFDEPWLDKRVYFAALDNALRTRLGADLKLDTPVSEIVRDGDTYKILVDEIVVAESYKLVVCTGILGKRIDGLANLGPLMWVRGDAIGVYTKDNRPLLSRHIYMGKGFITPRKDGYMLLGATYIEESAPPVNLPPRDRIGFKDFQNLIDFNKAILPRLEECEISHAWRGWRPTAPDNMPVLGPLAKSPELVVANGFIGLGITMAPAVAKTVADYFLQGLNNFPRRFDPNRNFTAKARGGG